MNITCVEKICVVRWGFALTATLLLIMLMTLIVLGTLSLSAVTLRSTSRDSAQAIAQANARMALMIAIGELQKYAGPDTRVTAPSGIVNESAPPLIGVWKSWEGSDHKNTGLPITPDYDSKIQAAAVGGRFLSWLVSGAEYGGAPTNPSALAFSVPTADTVPILYKGTLGDNPVGAVHLVPILANDSGAYAWWVSGENQKARLPIPYMPENVNSLPQWSDATRSHAVPDPKAFELETLLVDSSPAAKAVTLGTADLIAGEGVVTTPRESFHDLSVCSSGLLTNTATGGWRKDMSLMTENWDALPNRDLPFFRIYASHTSLVSKPMPPPYHQATQSILYPWSKYAVIPEPMYQHGAVSSWHNLKDYATAYKRINTADGGYNTPFHAPHLLDNYKSFDYLHKIRIAPIIARVHWVFSHGTKVVAGDPANLDDDTYNLQMLITPVITMWNPFNVSITSPTNLRILMAKPIPCAFRHYNKDGIPHAQYRRLTTGYGGGFVNDGQTPGNRPPMVPSVNALSYLIPAPFTLAPGETRVFSPTSLNPVAISASNLAMSPGYRPNTGHTVNLTPYIGALNPNSKVKVDIVFDALFLEGGGGELFSGVWLDMFLGTSGSHYLQVNRMQYPPATARTYWPPIVESELSSPTAQEINNTWRPFFSAVYGSRISGPSSTGLPGKGLMQASPLVSYIRMQQNHGGNMGNHPAKGASDFSFFKHTGNDDKMPNANNTNNRGFIISGFTAADGLSRMILSELPMRPLVSLGELQNWDMRGQNGVPPFQLNVIANSDASYLIPPDKVCNSLNPLTLLHDDSYCANHLLFDDWFFSSIAPQPLGFGSVTADDLRENYTKFLRGERPLVNRAYRRIHQDISLDSSKINKRVDDVLSPDGWQRVASRFEVEGMFNVNSVSLKAWRALLGHARNQKIPHHTQVGMALSEKTDHAYSRFNIAGDKMAGDPGMSGSFPESTEITGYRVFEDELLDIMAEKIVEQLRLRGPFLSLSEFVNRQLSSDKNLALSGCIQTALNKMSDEAGDNDPLKTLKSPDLSQDAGDVNDPRLAGAGYLFPEAAVGKSTYGMPGWTRQADVLSPIAPILSVRDDTFTIRAYGDARDNKGKILTKAWCEATVCRTRDYVDPADAADITTAPSSAVNQIFGRSFKLIAFRWLSVADV